MTVDEITRKVLNALPAAEIHGRDLTGGGDHFELFVISDLFGGKSRVQRQQMVMAPLAEELKGPLHALTMKTYTREEWEKAQQG